MILLSPPPFLIEPDTRKYEVIPLRVASEGADGEVLKQQLNTVLQHWKNRESDAEASTVDDRIYSRPLRTIGKMKIRYVKAGPLKPRVIDFGEDNQ